MHRRTHTVGGDQKGYTLSLRVPPDPRFAATVRQALSGFAALHGVSSYDVEPLVCALGEALANAIEHAATTRDLEVQAEVHERWIEAVVTDHGCGLLAIPAQPAPLPASLAERGRGIPMMQRCTDIFSVESLPGAGTTVRLTRWRTAARTGRGSLS